MPKYTYQDAAQRYGTEIADLLQRVRDTSTPETNDGFPLSNLDGPFAQAVLAANAKIYRGGNWICNFAQCSAATVRNILAKGKHSNVEDMSSPARNVETRALPDHYREAFATIESQIRAEQDALYAFSEALRFAEYASECSQRTGAPIHQDLQAFLKLKQR